MYSVTGETISAGPNMNWSSMEKVLRSEGKSIGRPRMMVEPSLVTFQASE
jgi:hypothetical protein